MVIPLSKPNIYMNYSNNYVWQQLNINNGIQNINHCTHNIELKTYDAAVKLNNRVNTRLNS